MSFVRFDFRCRTCRHQEELFVRREHMNVQPCPKCDAELPMDRLPAGTRTLFRYADTKLKA